MKQQCSLVAIYANGAILLGVLAYFVVKGSYVAAVVWLVAFPVGLAAYIRIFPAISRYIGYGSLADRQAESLGPAPTRVRFYTALGCPFCPVVYGRLISLQAEMGFDLDEVDVTLRPNLLIAKAIYAVPVVEIGEQRLVGHATSHELASFVRGSLGTTVPVAS